MFKKSYLFSENDLTIDDKILKISILSNPKGDKS